MGKILNEIIKIAENQEYTDVIINEKNYTIENCEISKIDENCLKIIYDGNCDFVFEKNIESCQFRVNKYAKLKNK